MKEKDVPTIVFIIFFTALVVGLLLGLTIRSVDVSNNIITNSFGGICKATENGQNCIGAFATIAILLFILSIVEIVNLKQRMGRYNTGVVVYFLGLIFGFIISFIF